MASALVQNIEQLVEPIAGYFGEDVCSKEISIFMQKIKFKHYEKLTCFLYNQKPIIASLIKNESS